MENGSGYIDYYQLLGVVADAGPDELKSAFRKLSQIHHPDHNNNSPESAGRFRVILNIYTILSDPVSRAEYDSWLKNSTVLGRTGSAGFSAVPGRQALSGSVLPSGEILFQQLNYLLWEIEDLIRIRSSVDLNTQYGNRPLSWYVWEMLTFLDRWVLGPAGYPDYFMQARRLTPVDPRTHRQRSSAGPGHHPYAGIVDYFFTIRMRADKMMSGTGDNRLAEKIPGYDITLADAVIESNNLSIHYLGYLLDSEEGSVRNIPSFKYSKSDFIR